LVFSHGEVRKVILQTSKNTDLTDVPQLIHKF